MKIGLIGNMNNNHFALGRYLRSIGFDAELLLTDCEYPHFHPSSDTLGEASDIAVRQLTWGHARALTTIDPRHVAADLRHFDILIGCGLSPAYCERAGRVLDVFVPYGGDLWEATMFSPCKPRNLLPAWRAAYLQRRAIAMVPVVHMSPAMIYERRLSRLAPSCERWREGLPMVFHPMYDIARLERLLNATTHGRRFQAIRSNSDLMVFSSVRHSWRIPASDPAAKGTDLLLRALAKIRRVRPNLRVRLVTMEYGKDVEASKRLAHELGIGETIEWFPIMARRELMAGLMLSDVACAEFQNSFESSGVIYEALVARKPLVMHRFDGDYSDNVATRTLVPALTARAPGEIADRLIWVADHPSASCSLGQAGHDWYLTQVVRPALCRYSQHLNSRANR